jgi:hypothetical protein
MTTTAAETRTPHSPAMPVHGHRAARIISVAFVIAIALPLLGVPFHWDLVNSAGENRALAPLPAWPRDFSQWSAFPAAFREYFKDHFGFRNTLIRINAEIKYRAFGVSTNPRVVIGKAGWLFFFYDTDKELAGFRGEIPFTQDELNHWQRVLEERQAWLAQRGIPYLLIIPPDKQTIYPDKLRDTLHRGAGPTRLDQLIAHLAAHSTVRIVDMRQQLLTARHDFEQRLYHKTDSHWNDYGAYVGYRAILEAIAQAMPNKRVQPQPMSAFEPSIRREGGDLVGMLGLKGSIEEDRLQLGGRVPAVATSGWMQRRITDGETFTLSAIEPRGPTERLVPKGSGGTRYGEQILAGRNDPSLPSIVMIRDSFGNALLPMLAEHFRRGVYCSSDNFESGVIDAEHPDVVATEIVERKLYQPPVENPPEVRAALK